MDHHSGSIEHDKGGQKADEGSGFGHFLSHVWSKTKSVRDGAAELAEHGMHSGEELLHKGASAGGHLLEQAGKNVDTKKLVKEGKEAGEEAVKAAQGKSGNKTVDNIVDQAGQWIPGAGAVQEGAKLLDRSHVLDGKRSQLDKHDLEEAVKRVGPSMIGVPLPEGAMHLKALADKAGVTDRVTGAIESQARREHSGEHPSGHQAEGQGKNDHLPKVDIVRSAEEAGKEGAEKGKAAWNWLERHLGSDKNTRK